MSAIEVANLTTREALMLMVFVNLELAKKS